jgi:hypothetical protein
VLLANVRFPAGYRYPGRVDAGLVAAVIDRGDAAVGIGELEGAWAGRAGEVRAAVLHLVWRGVFRVGRHDAGACRVTARPEVTTVTTGTVIVYDGEAWTVSGIEAGRLLLAGAWGRSLLADTVQQRGDTQC